MLLPYPSFGCAVAPYHDVRLLYVLKPLPVLVLLATPLLLLLFLLPLACLLLLFVLFFPQVIRPRR